MERRAFTFVELVLVLAVLVVFAANMVPLFSGHAQEARRTAFYDFADVMSSACRRYHADTGLYAAEDLPQMGLPSYAYGLSMNDGRSPAWNGPYISRPISVNDNPCRQDNWHMGISGYNPPWSVVPAHFDLDGNGTVDTRGGLNSIVVSGCTSSQAKAINDRYDSRIGGNWMTTGRVEYNGTLFLYLLGGTD